MALKLAGARLLMKGGFLNRTNYVRPMSSATVVFGGAFAMALADWTLDNDGNAENKTVKNWPSPQATLSDPTHIQLNTAESGTGTVLLTQPITGNAEAPVSGATFGMDAGQLMIGAAATTKATGRGLREAYETGLVSGNKWLTVHSGAPGEGGANQQGNAIAFAAASWGEKSGARGVWTNTVAANFGAQPADLPDLMYVALRDAASSGNVLWSDAYDNNPDDPAAGATLSFPIGMLEISVLSVDAL